MNNAELEIVIETFGHKYGCPPDNSSIVIDARSIPNPHGTPGLETLTGFDEPIIEYIMRQPITADLVESMCQQVASALCEILVGKSKNKKLLVAIGCKGGRQRSVCLAGICQRFAVTFLHAHSRQADISVVHRDLEQDLLLELRKGDNHVHRTS